MVGRPHFFAKLAEDRPRWSEETSFQFLTVFLVSPNVVLSVFFVFSVGVVCRVFAQSLAHVDIHPHSSSFSARFRESLHKIGFCICGVHRNCVSANFLFGIDVGNVCQHYCECSASETVLVL